MNMYNKEEHCGPSLFAKSALFHIFMWMARALWACGCVVPSHLLNLRHFGFENMTCRFCILEGTYLTCTLQVFLVSERLSFCIPRLPPATLPITVYGSTKPPPHAQTISRQADLRIARLATSTFTSSTWFTCFHSCLATPS